MKKIILAVMAASMLLTNVVFASTSAKHVKNSTVPNVNQNSVLHLDSVDPN